MPTPKRPTNDPPTERPYGPITKEEAEALAGPAPPWATKPPLGHPDREGFADMRRQIDAQDRRNPLPPQEGTARGPGRGWHWPASWPSPEQMARAPENLHPDRNSGRTTTMLIDVVRGQHGPRVIVVGVNQAHARSLAHHARSLACALDLAMEPRGFITTAFTIVVMKRTTEVRFMGVEELLGERLTGWRGEVVFDHAIGSIPIELQRLVETLTMRGRR